MQKKRDVSMPGTSTVAFCVFTQSWGCLGEIWFDISNGAQVKISALKRKFMHLSKKHPKVFSSHSEQSPADCMPKNLRVNVQILYKLE